MVPELRRIPETIRAASDAIREGAQRLLAPPHEPARVPARARSSVRDESGIAIVVFSIAMTALLGMVSLTIDVARTYQFEREMQNAADAAALAGVAKLPNVAAAEAAALQYWQANEPKLGAATPTITITYPASVSVSATASVPRLFGTGSMTRSVNSEASQRQADIMVVLDRSGSMDTADAVGFDSRIAAARESAKNFAALFDPAFVTMGLASYSTTATMDLGLTSSFGLWDTSFEVAVDGLSADGWTNVGHSIQVARDELALNGRPDATQIIVLLSDGIANRCGPAGSDCGTNGAKSYALDQAIAAETEGVVLYTIGLGDGADEQFMDELANTGRGISLLAPTSADLDAAFQQIADEMRVLITR